MGLFFTGLFLSILFFAFIVWVIGIVSSKHKSSNIIRNNNRADIELGDIQREEQKENDPQIEEQEDNDRQRMKQEETEKVDEQDGFEQEEDERQREEEYAAIQFLKVSIQRSDDVINYLQGRLARIETSAALEIQELSLVNSIENQNFVPED